MVGVLAGKFADTLAKFVCVREDDGNSEPVVDELLHHVAGDTVFEHKKLRV